MASSLLALLDDIASVLDDVATTMPLWSCSWLQQRLTSVADAAAARLLAEAVLGLIAGVVLVGAVAAARRLR